MQFMSGAGAVRQLLDLEPVAETEPDWQNLRREGLLCLAADGLLRRRHPLPDHVRQTFIQAVAFEMQCRQALTEISLAAQAVGIEVVTFKGCALAFGLYPRPGQRSFGDIDLAVQPECWDATVELLQRLRFQRGSEGNFVRQALQVDLHRHPLHQLTRLVGPIAHEWWQAAQPLQVGAAFRLAYHHEFVLTLFHAAKHSFSRAGWLVDLALLAQQVDPGLLATTVRRHRVHRQLALAAECLERWFGANLSKDLAELTPRRWNLFERRFLSLVIRRQAPDFLGMLTPLSSAPNFWAGLTYLVQALYPPDVPRLKRSRQLIGMARSALLK